MPAQTFDIACQPTNVLHTNISWSKYRQMSSDTPEDIRRSPTLDETYELVEHKAILAWYPICPLPLGDHLQEYTTPSAVDERDEKEPVES